MNTNKTTRKNRGGADNADISNYVFMTTQLTTQPSIDPLYKEIGIIHFTDSGSINALREFATGISNIFGKKGFDNIIYDKIRNQALTNFQTKLKPNQKVSNLRIELNNNAQDTIFIHIYGTLLQKN